MKRNSLIHVFGSTFVTLFLLCLLVSAQEVQAFSPSKSKSWRVVQSSNTTMQYNMLSGVTALAANDAWAVGQAFSYSNPSQALIEHWNGKQWKLVPAPIVGQSSELYAVTPIPGTKELWAVGSQSTSTDYMQTLVERWDGSRWQVMPTPIYKHDPAAFTNIFYGVTALSKDNAWAVGVYYKDSSNPQVALIEHWNGKKWSVSPAPALPNLSFLYGITALSATNIWVVGASFDTAITEHWNGAAWKLVSAPNPGSIANFFYGVSAIPGTQTLWAVGNSLNTVGGAYQTLVERWDGSKWTVVTSPSPGSNGNGLQGVAALSAKNAWAIGSYTNGQGDDEVLTEHWNGTAWSNITAPQPSTVAFLYAITIVPKTNRLWSVGAYSVNQNEQTLTELYS